jgi:hypothetical protein
MYPPTRKKCPFGCANKKDPRGKPAPHTLIFDRYEFDDTISPELLRTWKLGHSTGDLWKKHEAIRESKRKDMKMNIRKRDGGLIKTDLPQQFTPFRSGLAGQSEQHAEQLRSWLRENMKLDCVYLGVQDGVVFLDERVQR